jgi:hypothetical protein
MVVMPSNSGKAIVHYWAGRYPGRLGHLYSPAGRRGPFPWLPYCLDNDVYGAWAAGRPWDAEAFRAHLRWAAAAPCAPGWVVMPDAVGDRATTLRQWDAWETEVRAEGWPVALAVQDGMTPADAAATGCDVVFLGGTTDWKRAQLRRLSAWRRVCARVHVGRINTGRWLWLCAEQGAESCDGTGWFRGDPRQLAELEEFVTTYGGARRAREHGPLFAQAA